MNHQENHECDQLVNCERHVVERLSAMENRTLHLRQGDLGRPQLAGQLASDLRRTQYVLGRGKKICLALRGELSAAHAMPCCECNWNEKVKLERKGEAAAEETRTAERRKGKLRKIHHRGSLDRTRVQPDVVEHAGLETQKGVRACG